MMPVSSFLEASRDVLSSWIFWGCGVALVGFGSGTILDFVANLSLLCVAFSLPYAYFYQYAYIVQRWYADLYIWKNACYKWFAHGDENCILRAELYARCVYFAVGFFLTFMVLSLCGKFGVWWETQRFVIGDSFRGAWVRSWFCPKSGVRNHHGQAVADLGEKEKVAAQVASTTGDFPEKVAPECGKQDVSVVVESKEEQHKQDQDLLFVGGPKVEGKRSTQDPSDRKRLSECLPLCDDDSELAEALAPVTGSVAESDVLDDLREEVLEMLAETEQVRVEYGLRQMRKVRARRLQAIEEKYEVAVNGNLVYDTAFEALQEYKEQQRKRREALKQEIADRKTGGAKAEGKLMAEADAASRELAEQKKADAVTGGAEVEQKLMLSADFAKLEADAIARAEVEKKEQQAMWQAEFERNLDVMKAAKEAAELKEKLIEEQKSLLAKRTVPGEVVRESKQVASFPTPVGRWPDPVVALAIPRGRDNVSVVGMGFRAEITVGTRKRSDLICTALHVFVQAYRSGQPLVLVHGDRRLHLDMDILKHVIVTAETRVRRNRDGTVTTHLGLDFIVFCVDAGRLATLGVSKAVFHRAKEGDVITCTGYADVGGRNVLCESRGRIYRTGEALLARHSATTYAGWSGCPVFDLKGRVVGIHTGNYGLTTEWKDATNCCTVLGAYFTRHTGSRMLESQEETELYDEVGEDDFDNDGPDLWDLKDNSRGYDEKDYDIEYGGATNRVRARGQMASTDDPQFMDEFDKISDRHYTLKQLEAFIDQEYQAGRLNEEQADYVYNNAMTKEEYDAQRQGPQVYDTDYGFSGYEPSKHAGKDKGDRKRKGDRDRESGDVELPPQVKQMHSQMDSFLRHVQPRYQALAVQLEAALKRSDVIRRQVEEFDAYMARGQDLLLKSADADLNELNRFDAELKRRHYEQKAIEDRNQSEIRNLRAVQERLRIQTEEYLKRCAQAKSMHTENAVFRDARKNDLLAEMERRRQKCEAELTLIAELRDANAQKVVQMAALRDERVAAPPAVLPTAAPAVETKDTPEAKASVETKVDSAEVKKEVAPQQSVRKCLDCGISDGEFFNVENPSGVVCQPCWNKRRGQAPQAGPIWHEETDQDKLSKLVESPENHESEFKGGKVAESRKVESPMASVFPKGKAEAMKKAPPAVPAASSEEPKPKFQFSEVTAGNHPWFTKKAWKGLRPEEKEFHSGEYNSVKRLCEAGNLLALERMKRLCDNKQQAPKQEQVKPQEVTKPKEQASSGSTKSESTDGKRSRLNSSKTNEGLHPWFTPLEWEKKSKEEQKAAWSEIGKDENGKFKVPKEVNDSRKAQREVRWVEELKVSHPETWGVELQRLKDKDRDEFIERKAKKQLRQDAAKTPLERMAIQGMPEYAKAQFWRDEISPRLNQVTQIQFDEYLEKARELAKRLPQDPLTFVNLDLKGQMEAFGILAKLTSVIEDYNQEQKRMYEMMRAQMKKEVVPPVLQGLVPSESKRS